VLPIPRRVHAAHGHPGPGPISKHLEIQCVTRTCTPLLTLR
jgi:hypothetical protein